MTPAARLALAMVRDAIHLLATEGRGRQHIGSTAAARDAHRRRWLAETQAWVDGAPARVSLRFCAEALGHSEAELRDAITSCVARLRDNV